MSNPPGEKQVIEHNSIMLGGSLAVWSQLLTFEIFQKYFMGGHFTLA
jgi:hypothetical protein